jgi:cytochrome c biogenesis protein ResB
MMMLLKKLASLRLTLVGMVLLAMLAVVGSRNADIGAGITAVPLAILVVNLLAALLTNKSIRTQTGLLVFHVGLLLVFVCIGLTVLLRYDGHVEVVQGGEFDAGLVETVAQGRWHDNRLDELEFSQGEIRVNYLAGLNRQDTHSTLEYRTATGEIRRITVGDTRTVTIDGYRIAATFNKGFALLLHWTGADGREMLGAVHMPSFPEFDWKQVTTWTTPEGQQVQLELMFDESVSDDRGAWSFGSTDVPYSVNVSVASEPQQSLRRGGSVELAGGVVRMMDLRTWMAYQVDYLPLLPWMLVAALLAIVGLAMHFASRYLPASTTARAKEDDYVYVARV